MVKPETQFLAVALSVAALSTASGQGTFQNLNFESASFVPIPGDPYGRVQFAPAFPGWIASVGTSQQTAALSNNFFLDSSGMSIIDNDWPFLFGGVIEGNFTAIVQAGFALGTFTLADTSLSQTGTIPAGTESLRFKAFADFGFSSSFAVSLGGQTLSLTPLENGPNYREYGADIPGWAGQTTELRFTVFCRAAACQ